MIIYSSSVAAKFASTGFTEVMALSNYSLVIGWVAFVLSFLALYFVVQVNKETTNAQEYNTV